MKTFREFLVEQDDDNAITGVHYSHRPDLSVLLGGKSGSGIKGAEQERLKQSKDDRIRKRVYFYPKHGEALPQPEQGLGVHTYETKLHNMYDARNRGEDYKKVATLAQKYKDEGEHPDNAFERSVLDHGFHGYHTDNMSVVLGRNVPVKYTGSSVGKQFVAHQTDTKPKPFSVFDSIPNKEGMHTSSNLSNPQTMYYLQNKAKLAAAAPSLKMQYGRLNVHKDDVEKLHNELQQNHPNHPF